MGHTMNDKSKWDLADLKACSNLSYAQVWTGTRVSDGALVALKLCKDSKTAQKEAAALQFYEGRGCVKLLDFDQNALLLEQVAPGTLLKSLFLNDDDKAVKIISKIMRQLHGKSLGEPSGFPTLEELVSRTFSRPQGIDVEEAKALSKDLLQSTNKQVLLHGDLHHGNVLWSKGRGWLAIDPKGIAGDPAYDVAAFVLNPIPELYRMPDVSKIMSRRLKLFSEMLTIEQNRLRDWTYVHAVMAACWAIEDGEDPSQWMLAAEWLPAPQF